MGRGGEPSSPEPLSEIPPPADPTTRRTSVRLYRHSRSVPKARRFVEQTLRRWHCEDPERIAALLTTEVVTNAVRHTRSSVQLELAVDANCVLTVATVDDHPDLPILKAPSASDESGRGIWLVEWLARRWGVRQLADGRKVVWFELPLTRLGAPVAAPITR